VREREMEEIEEKERGHKTNEFEMECKKGKLK